MSCNRFATLLREFWTSSELFYGFRQGKKTNANRIRSFVWRRHETIVAVMEIFATTGYEAETHTLLDEMAFTKRMGVAGSWRSDNCYSTESGLNQDLDPERTNFRNEHARRACLAMFESPTLISESSEKTLPFLPTCMCLLASVN